jgi:hypothetical protein
VVYPPDGTVSPFTVINLGSGAVQMGDCIHDRRLPALWFGKNGQGMGHEELMNREAREGETLAVVTFANVEGLDVLASVIQRIRRVSFPDACATPAPMSKHTPGPWSQHLVKVQRDITGPHGQSIAYTRGADWSGDKSESEELANARLIAAAPELLEALREVVAISDRKHDAWDKAHAAMAKAAGTGST